MSVFDKVMEYAENAPEAGRPNLTYGKVTMTPYVLKFHGKGQKAEHVPLDGKEDLTGKVLALVFEVDIQEFNPNLQFGYEREVQVQKSKVKGEQVVLPTDWSETVLPSLVDVFGEKWADNINGTYVEVEDVLSVRSYTNVQGEKKTLNTIKFLRKFKNKEECLAARNETYGQAGDSGEVAEGNASQIPASLANKVRGLVDAVGIDAARSMIPSSPEFQGYDVDALLTAANPL